MNLIVVSILVCLSIVCIYMLCISKKSNYPLIPEKYRHKTDKVELYVVPDFLTDDECTSIIHLINYNNRPSTITVEHPDKLYRTSRTSELSNMNNSDVATLTDKICDYIGISKEYSEGMQGQKYAVGQEFKSHTDYFIPDSQEWDNYAVKYGQRTWTFMIYLNDVEEGGHTTFTELGLSIKPKKGTAVIWNNLDKNGNGNTSTLHSGEPIKKGEKYIITNWFRQKPYP